MKIKRCALLVLFSLVAVYFALAQGVDPKTVKPAWEIEKQLEKENADAKAAADAAAKDMAVKNIVNAFNVFFIGYDVPSLSGSLADDLASWKSPINFSLGMETSTAQASSLLFGVEGEFLVTFNDAGSRLLMNDMVMFGYSLNLKPLRVNAGVRAGLSILDVTASTAYNTYTGFGFVFGPEASVYLAFDPRSWIWLRGRYSMASYISMDSDSSPIVAGNDTLDFLSLEAGLAFKM